MLKTICCCIRGSDNNDSIVGVPYANNPVSRGRLSGSTGAVKEPGPHREVLSQQEMDELNELAIGPWARFTGVYYDSPRDRLEVYRSMRDNYMKKGENFTGVVLP